METFYVFPRGSYKHASENKHVEATIEKGVVWNIHNKAMRVGPANPPTSNKNIYLTMFDRSQIT